MQKKEWANAEEVLSSALAYYDKFLNDADHQARIKQIKNMITGCRAKL